MCSRSVADEVYDAFTEVFESKAFRIERMERIDKYAGDDDASMAANNTSAFNCRYVGGTKILSAHALGIAIDINPIQNPLVTQKNVYPPEGKKYAKNRSADVIGIILKDDVVTAAFGKIKTSPAGNNWSWGGDWKGARKDYQHFSENGK
jgi:poly-gamma-glutamate synthesis protein (capsule biosynthesis protein)